MCVVYADRERASKSYKQLKCHANNVIIIVVQKLVYMKNTLRNYVRLLFDWHVLYDD